MLKLLFPTIAILSHLFFAYGDYGNFEEIPETDKMLKEIKSAENEEIGEVFFDGDMRLTLEQIEMIQQQRRHKRTAMEDILKWEMPLHYLFHSSLSENARKAVYSAVKVIERESCVRFEQVENDYKKPHVTIYHGTGQLSGCWSFIGREKYLNPQELSLGTTCGNTMTAIHELLHAVGFVHEQSRKDRDNFIEINWDNIEYGTENNNFKKLQTRDVACYDFGSIMQYSEKGGTVELGTLVAKDKYYQDTMRTSTRGSFIDWFTLNELYCRESCKKELKCQNGGYVDPNDCNRCKCVEGFGGDDCARIVATKTCEAKSKWSEPQSVLMMPSKEKIFYFKTKPGKKIQLKLNKNDAECFEKYHNCVKQYVEIKLGNSCSNRKDVIPNFRGTGYRMCKCTKNDSDVIFESVSNSAFIVAKNREKKELFSNMIHKFKFEFQYRSI